MATLKELREKRGIKQVAIAEHLGITRQTYACYEARPSSMSIAQAKAVCEYIGCPLDEFFLADDVD